MKKKTKKQHIIQSDYLESVYGKDFVKLVPAALKKIKQVRKYYPFDAIAFSGSSGAALAFPLSFLLEVPLIHIRKGRSHTHLKLEGTISSKRYLIVDDFIESGRTIKRIVSTIDDHMGSQRSKPSAICLYASDRLAPFTFRGNTIPIFVVPGFK